MKLSRFAVLQAVLAFVMSVPAFADSINLIPSGSESGVEYYSYSFPLTQYYGTTLLYTAICCGGWDTSVHLEVGSTVGLITTFSSSYFQLHGVNLYYVGALNNAAFNSATDTLTGTFVVGKTTYHLTEVFVLDSSQNYGDFTAQYGTMSKGSISTGPEPGTLALFGTGIVGMAEVIRKKLSILPRCNG